MSDRQLTMKVAGGLVKHLGLQMYSGAVPALAELVSNSWDAMAESVIIDVPINRKLEPTDIITVLDDGHGMTWEECQNKYLVIGRDRRKETGDLSDKYKDIPRRKIMSRKGIGKLAGFGIANNIEVKTINSGFITHFSMSFREIEKNQDDLSTYEPKMFEDDGKKTIDAPGTEIKLTELKITKSIQMDSFLRSLTRRFSILSDPNFSIFINDDKISKTEMPFQIRIPENANEWTTENIKGVGEVRFWFGFTDNPIKDDLARGVVVFCRGKLAQSPWFFDMSGGGYSSYGMQYLTGEVETDALDITDGVDLIATDRGSVRWDESPADLLRVWGQDKLRTVFDKWGKKRTNIKTSRPIVRKFLELGDKLPEKQKNIYRQFVSKLTSIPQLDKDDEILDELVRFGYNALTNQSFFEVIKQLNVASIDDLKSVDNLLDEWSIIEVVSAAQIVKGRVEVINLFEKMIESGAREIPDIHNFLKEHPWLIDPTWDTLADEETLDNLLKKQFDVEPELLPDGRKRLDFFCKGDSGRLFVVEIKRADFKCTTPKELYQLLDYVHYIRKQETQNMDTSRRRKNVDGVLVAGDFSSDLTSHIEGMAKDGFIIKRWHDLLITAKKAHKEYFNLVQSKAPQDDPRIKDLKDI